MHRTHSDRTTRIYLGMLQLRIPRWIVAYAALEGYTLGKRCVHAMRIETDGSQSARNNYVSLLLQREVQRRAEQWLME